MKNEYRARKKEAPRRSENREEVKGFRAKNRRKVPLVDGGFAGGIHARAAGGC